MAFPVKPTAILGVVREIRVAAEDLRPLVVSGALAEAERLGAALAEGGEARWVRVVAGRRPTKDDIETAALVVHVVDGEPGADDTETFRLAAREDTPVLCVLLGAEEEAVTKVPYVLATDVIAVPPGELAPRDAVVERVAGSLGDKGYALAGKLPAIRRAVCKEIVERFARQNGILGAAVFIPGADLPVMTLNQIRMVLRLAGAYGEVLDRERAVEVLGVVGAGVGLRAVARQVAGLVPVAGWAVKGAIGYTGTKALGETAIRYFEAGGVRAAGESVRSWS
jgi:uncharacterized protein (DUF697 family)